MPTETFNKEKYYPYVLKINSSLRKALVWKLGEI